MNIFSNIKKWYHEAYPTDDMWEEIDDDLTFVKIYGAFKAREDIYDYIPGDSIIRERIFEKLVEILNTYPWFEEITYDTIFTAWLDRTMIPCSKFPTQEEVMENRWL